MPLIDLKAEAQAAMNDPEFSREMRYFNGKLKLAIDADETVLSFNDGKLAGISKDTVSDADCRVFVKGTHAMWTNMLARYPVPFYQCIQTTNIKHGLKLSTTNETFAYLPALNRLLQILRDRHNQE
jgi:hypothetical protein